VTNWRRYAEIVRGAAASRRVAQAARQIEQAAVNGQPVDEFVSSLERLGVNESNTRASTLPIAPLSELLANTPPEPEWLWTGFVAPGVITLLAGQPKVGKTTTLFGLLAAIEKGDPFLGLATRPAKVLLLTEERETTLAEKRKRWDIDPHTLFWHTTRDTTWAKLVGGAHTYCVKNGIDVIVVDTWDKWNQLGGDQENSSGAVNEAMQPLMAAAGGGLCIIITTHQRKSGGEHGEAVRGSNALPGAVDVIVELERSRDARVLRTTSRFSSTPDEVVLVLSEDGYAAYGSLAEYQADSDLERLFAAVKDAAEPLTADEVAGLVDVSKQSSQRSLKKLHEKGRISRLGQGKKGDPYKYGFVSFAAHSLRDETNTKEAA
jgi:predicted ATP-dependent serine protease